MVQGRRPTKDQNEETVNLINCLKKYFGYLTDKELAERYNMLPQELLSLKRGGLSKLTKGVIKDIIKNK